MWSCMWDGGTGERNDGSGFVLRRLVVRRAEDSFLREIYGIRFENEGSRKGKFEDNRRERRTDMSLLWIVEHNRTSRSRLIF